MSAQVTDMPIDEIKKMKKALEAEIAGKIAEFDKKTGLKTLHIMFERNEVIIMPQETELCVNYKVELSVTL